MTFPVTPVPPREADLPLHEIDDHADRALSRLLTQFREKPRLATVISIFERVFQELEGVFWDLRVKRYLSTAEGAQLDVIGRVLKEPRVSLTDAQYRLVLGAKVLVLRSSGTAPELMRIASILLDGVAFTLTEIFPAALSVTILGSPLLSTALIKRFLVAAKSAGVRLDVVGGLSGPAFIYGTSTAPTTSTTTGYDHGHYSGVL